MIIFVFSGKTKVDKRYIPLWLFSEGQKKDDLLVDPVEIQEGMPVDPEAKDTPGTHTIRRVRIHFGMRSFLVDSTAKRRRKKFIVV